MLTNEQIIMDMQTKGNPFMAKFSKNESVFFGTDDELKILMVCAINSRTKTLAEQKQWIDEVSKTLEEVATQDCEI